jgi:hypothetical protein
MAVRGVMRQATSLPLRAAGSLPVPLIPVRNTCRNFAVVPPRITVTA